jgi:hypothetical protein
MYLCSPRMKICLNIEVMLILLFIFVVLTKYSSLLDGLPWELGCKFSIVMHYLLSIYFDN